MDLVSFSYYPRETGLAWQPLVSNNKRNCCKHSDDVPHLLNTFATPCRCAAGLAIEGPSSLSSASHTAETVEGGGQLSSAHSEHQSDTHDDDGDGDALYPEDEDDIEREDAEELDEEIIEEDIDDDEDADLDDMDVRHPLLLFQNIDSGGHGWSRGYPLGRGRACRTSNIGKEAAGNAHQKHLLSRLMGHQ